MRQFHATGECMPIGVVSDADFEKELAKLSNRTKLKVVDGTVVEKQRPGRSDGDTNVPDSLRKIIGEESVINGRSSALQIAEQFGISPSSVSAYAKGATSTTTYDQPKESIISHINKSRRRHIKKASHVLSQALGSISQEKLDYADAKDLSSIAKDMAVIIKNLEPTPESVSTANTPQFTIYAPQFRDERSFEVINVQE